LEKLVHPLIHADAIRQLRMLKESDNPPVAVVIDAPLLIEAGWEPLCQAIIFVDTDTNDRRSRAMARDWTSQQFDSREAAQMPLEEKRQRATHILDGSLGPDELRRKLKQMLDQIVSPI
jgi:dephospho-CoA kinase